VAIAASRAAFVRFQFSVFYPRNPLPCTLKGMSDNDAYRFPVSVKGVVLRRGRVILLENERNEWELPGGKLELGETPASCVAREIGEELRLEVEPTTLLDSWVYAIEPGVHVLIVTYGCTEIREVDAVSSNEHRRVAWFAVADVDSLRMPDGYKASIKRWTEIVR
jgi:8-oxo-dGTP pyrophosphatase MutT (NUDIX family)